MRTRMLFCASAIALVAASCSQPEPHVLSEAPRATTATDLTSVTETTEREPEPGRFIARCATEADGGTPGMTMFTDGSRAVTDHCLSRYYMGVQPEPGALYVPDEDAGTYAPSRESETGPTPTYQWTPAQPRTDAGPDNGGFDDESDQTPDELDPESETETDEENPDGTETTPDQTSPEDTPTTTTPGAPGETTEPGESTTPGTTDPTSPDDTDTTTPGSSETPTTEVPITTVTEEPGITQTPPDTPVTSTVPSGPQAATTQQGTPGPSGTASAPGAASAPGSQGSASVPGSQGSAGSGHTQSLPFPFGSLHFAPPTAVQSAPAPGT